MCSAIKNKPYAKTAADAVYKLISGWRDKPCDVGFGVYPPGTPSIMISPKSSAYPVCAFDDGGMLMKLPFTVSIRCSAKDSASALAAVDCLNSLTDYLKVNLPTLFGNDVPVCIALCLQPSRSDVFSNGQAEYSASYELFFDRNPSKEVHDE